MSEKDNALLAGPVRPALLRFAGPIILSMVATQLYTVADTMIIGLCLDSSSLAAVSNASTVLLIFLFVSGGMELGGGLLLAAKRPSSTPQELSVTIYNLLFIDGLIGLIMTLLGFLSMESCLRLINTPAEILPEAAEYAYIYLPGLPFLMIYDLSKQLVMGCGNSKTPLYAVLFTSLLNIALDFALVGPFGVGGAAAATAFSQLAGFCLMLAYLRRSLLTERFRPAMLKARYAWDVFRLSVPNAIQQASGPVSSLVKQSLLGGLGVAAIAGFSCASKLSTLLLMPVYGFAQSLVFFIAQNSAARQPERVRTGVRQARGIMLLYSAFVMLLCIFFAQPLLRLFTADGDALAYGALLLSREAIVCPFTAMKHLEEASLRGAQRMGLYLLSNIGAVAVNLAACAVLVPAFGYNGFYLSTFISAPISFVLAAALLRLSARCAARACSAA